MREESGLFSFHPNCSFILVKCVKYKARYLIQRSNIASRTWSSPLRCDGNSNSRRIFSGYLFVWVHKNLSERFWQPLLKLKFKIVFLVRFLFLHTSRSKVFVSFNRCIGALFLKWPKIYSLQSKVFVFIWVEGYCSYLNGEAGELSIITNLLTGVYFSGQKSLLNDIFL